MATAIVTPWLSSISASRSLLMICSGVTPFLAIHYSLLQDYNWYRFRERLGVERFANIFNHIVSLAKKKELISDRHSIVGNTHVKAKVDIFKMQNKPEHMPDKDALYGYKTINKTFLGYKAHAGIEADSELITRVDTAPGNVHDGDVFRGVVEDKSRMVTADKT